MVEFNEDGSLKLPGRMQAKVKSDENKLKNQKCIKIRRDIISSFSPKSCRLIITLSKAIDDKRFIQNIYSFFKQKASVPTELRSITETEYAIDVGTHFKRCSDCNNLIRQYREFLEGNLIDEKGSCTYERKTPNFAYEDYFD